MGNSARRNGVTTAGISKASIDYNDLIKMRKRYLEAYSDISIYKARIPMGIEFKIKPLTIEKQIHVAMLPEELLDMFRDGEVTLHQLYAIASTNISPAVKIFLIKEVIKRKMGTSELKCVRDIIKNQKKTLAEAFAIVECKGKPTPKMPDKRKPMDLIEEIVLLGTKYRSKIKMIKEHLPHSLVEPTTKTLNPIILEEMYVMKSTLSEVLVFVDDVLKGMFDELALDSQVAFKGLTDGEKG